MSNEQPVVAQSPVERTYGLGRKYEPDDRNFQMRTTVFRLKKLPVPRKRPYKLAPTLDQGETSQCVGYTGRHKLSAAPIMVKSGVGLSAFECYRGAQQRDQWEGDQYEGSSVLGLCKFLQEQQYITSYVWANKAAECHRFLHEGWGTIMVGTDWMSDMFRPDAKGFVRPSGPMEGGHAYHQFWSIDRGDPDQSELWFQNSWGPNWGITLYGVHGCFKMSWTDFDYLMARDGEAAAAIERKVKAPT
jgi:hypothetical protein